MSGQASASQSATASSFSAPLDQIPASSAASSSSRPKFSCSGEAAPPVSVPFTAPSKVDRYIVVRLQSPDVGQGSTRPGELHSPSAPPSGFVLEQDPSRTQTNHFIPRLRRPPSSSQRSRRTRQHSKSDLRPLPQLRDVQNTLHISLAVSPAPPAPDSAPGVTLSHRSNPNLKVVFLDDSQWQSCEDDKFTSATVQAALPPSDATPIPGHSFSTQFAESSSSRTNSSRSSSHSIITPASLSLDLAAAAVTPATTLSHTPHMSPTFKSELSASSLVDPRQDSNVPDATTPTPGNTAASNAAATVIAPPSKRTVPAWSLPRSWTPLANKDSGATSFTTFDGLATPSSSTRSIAASEAGPSQVTSPTSSAKSPPPTARAPAPWGKNQRPALGTLLSDAHTRFSAPVTEPRGLINTGNFCFANAILQVLVFCAPFYNLFTTVGKELSADLANTTPLMEAVVHFLREFYTVSKSSGSRDGTSNATELVHNPALSDPFIPEFVYEAMRLNKRFDLMRRGHQEDAEEFLGFFLDTLHEELLSAIRKSNARHASTNNLLNKMSAAERTLNGISDADVAGGDIGPDGELDVEEEREVQRPMSPSEEGWMEVGQKGKTAFTRTTSTFDSPITKIFGGKLRSVLRTPGVKDSVTLEPYQPLQLDIQPSNVVTIEDALLNLTVPETIPGVFSPARGGPVDATKQVFVESLPPVLILHLKRFFYDEVGGVQKNSKEVGYGDVLEVGGEVVSPTKRADGKVRYRLFGVVYHHGRYATGGHYTVDVLRQDGSSWIHFDDTLFNPVAMEHVGRRAGQSLSSSVGHDGLAYLLFYQREDVVRKHQQDQERSSQLRKPASKPANATQRAGVINGGHSRSSSGVPQSTGVKSTGSSGSAASVKQGATKKPGAGASKAHPEPPSPAPKETVRQIPGAAPGKTRGVVSGAQ